MGVGYGTGALTLTPGAARTSGLSMGMAAGGLRGEVAAVVGGFGLAFKADALWVGTSIDGVDGPAGGDRGGGDPVPDRAGGLARLSSEKSCRLSWRKNNPKNHCHRDSWCRARGRDPHLGSPGAAGHQRITRRGRDTPRTHGAHGRADGRIARSDRRPGQGRQLDQEGESQSGI